MPLVKNIIKDIIAPDNITVDVFKEQETTKYDDIPITRIKEDLTSRNGMFPQKYNSDG